MDSVFRLTATNVLIGINTVLFLLELVYPKVLYYGVLVPALILERPRTILTHAFLHANFLHIFFNMFFLRVLGNALEDHIGSKALVVSYLTIAVLVGLIHSILCLTIFTQYAYVPSLGASGAVMGVLGMSVIFLGEMRLRVVIFPIPIPMNLSIRELAVVLLTLETIMGLLNIEPGIAHDAHIAGLVLGYIIAKYGSAFDLHIRRPKAKVPADKTFSIELIFIDRDPKYQRTFYVYDKKFLKCLRDLQDLDVYDYLVHLIVDDMERIANDLKYFEEILSKCAPHTYKVLTRILEEYGFLDHAHYYELYEMAMLELIIRALMSERTKFVGGGWLE